MPTLIREWGVPPSFYMRYVGQYEVTPQEVADLQARGVRLGLVYNLGPANDPENMAWQAGDAIRRMHALGLHTILLKDIETNMPTTADALLAWSNVLLANDVPGGFYANTQWAAFDAPYNAIVGRVERKYRLIWTSEPEPGYYPPSSPPAWAPYTPSGDPSAVIMWQFTENTLGNIVDLNLATEEAYDLLSGPAPSTPPKPTVKAWRVGSPCDLKTEHNHTSPVAIDAKHRPVHLELGAFVSPTGKKATPGAEQGSTEEWWEVRIPLSPVHGWLLRSAIGEA